MKSEQCVRSLDYGGAHDEGEALWGGGRGRGWRRRGGGEFKDMRLKSALYGTKSTHFILTLCMEYSSLCGGMTK